MKKLMIATVVAVAGVAMANNICDPGATGGKYTCRAYDFAASVKLVDGKKGTDKASSVCAADGTVYYRVKATRKLKGVFTDCNPCQAWDLTQDPPVALPQPAGESFLIGEANGGARLYMATSAQKYKWVFTSEKYTGAIADQYKFLILNFFGGTTLKKSKYAEGLVAIDFVERDQYDEDRAYTILCAGFGARDGKMVKNLSGNLAGAVAAATWCGIPTICWEPCLETPYYDDLTFAQDGSFTYTAQTWQGLSPTSPAYDAVSGTWSLKYNASKSKLTSNEALMTKTFGKNYEFMVAPGGNAPQYPIGSANISVL